MRLHSIQINLCKTFTFIESEEKVWQLMSNYLKDFFLAFWAFWCRSSARSPLESCTSPLSFRSPLLSKPPDPDPGSTFPPWILDPQSFIRDQYIICKVLGRALTAGGFMGPTVLGLQRLDLTCGLNTWRFFWPICFWYLKKTWTVISLSTLGGVWGASTRHFLLLRDSQRLSWTFG